eukprot:COSAG01_NODE_45511_length_408_cov_18.407767_1_plen_22_part_10
MVRGMCGSAGSFTSPIDEQSSA